MADHQVLYTWLANPLAGDHTLRSGVQVYKKGNVTLTEPLDELEVEDSVEDQTTNSHNCSSPSQAQASVGCFMHDHGPMNLAWVL